MRPADKTPWTPGPWHHVHDAEPEDGLPPDVVMDNTKSLYIASVHAGLPEREHEANARLIAKAPEMAELLSEISDDDALDDGQTAAFLGETFERIRSVLADIRGRR